MIRLKSFRGEAPRLAATALPPDMSTQALNARLLSGTLEAWKDISSVFLLGKAGPTATVYPYDDGTGVTKWFSWATGELRNGATKVDVARIPIANDTTFRTVFTGTGKPQITNVAEALSGGVIGNGPYPVGSSDLAVPAPDAAPTVVSSGGSGDSVTTETYTGDFSAWTSGQTNGLPGVGTWGVTTTPPPALPPEHPDFDPPYFKGSYESPNANYATMPGGQGLALCKSFSVDFLLGGDLSTADQYPNGYCMLLGGGDVGYNAVGGMLRFNFRDNSAGGTLHAITWQDGAAGGAVTNIALGVVDQTMGVSVHVNAVNNGIVGSTRTFTVSVTVRNARTNAVLATVGNLPCTYGGEDVSLGGFSGTGSDTQYIFIGQVKRMVTTAATGFVPIYSNYLYTRANSLLLESGPSPASAPSVQVDNGFINTVTIPTPPMGEDDAEFFLYRVATGSSGSQFELVPNGNFSDGGFPLAVTTGTANALVLTTIDGAGPKDDTSYFFKAASNNTLSVTANLNGSGVKQIIDTDGNPLVAGAILSGNDYTLVYNKKYIKQTSNTVAAGSVVIPLKDTNGLSNGQVVTDPIGAVLPGTTVSSFVAGVSVTLSQGIGIDISSGGLLFFASTLNKYTLLAGLTYVDATPTSALGEPLQSTDWDPPPDNMIGIIALPNGVLAGFFGNTVCLSVAGQPQAWPLSYQLATDSQIVALVALGFNIGILTKGRPYTAYGTDPASMQMGIEAVPQGCESARGTAYSRLYGGIYPSTDGIYAYAGFGEIKNLTEALFTQREWQALNPSTLMAAVHQNLYFFWYQTLAGAKLGKVLDLNPAGFGLISLDFHSIAASIDSADDTLFMVLDSGTIAGGAGTANNELTQWEGANTYRHGAWTSKLYEQAYQQAMQIERVRANSYAGLTTQLLVNGTAQSVLTPIDRNEFTIEPVKGDRHQLQIAWDGSANPQVSQVDYAERIEEIAQADQQGAG